MPRPAPRPRSVRTTGASVTYLAWLPRWRHLLVNGVEGGGESSSQIFSVSYPDGAVTRITSDLSPYSGLSVAADGASFVSVRHETRSRIWAIPDGNMDRAHEVTTGAGTDDGVTGLAWTPTGRLVYAASTSGNLDIWIMDADGANRVQLTNAPEDDTLPIVTPDGSTIVFISERDGVHTLWRMDVDGSAQSKLGVGPVAFRPVMSFDGKWVYYSDPKRQNFRIPVRRGDAGAAARRTDCLAAARCRPRSTSRCPRRTVARWPGTTSMRRSSRAHRGAVGGARARRSGGSPRFPRTHAGRPTAGA